MSKINQLANYFVQQHKSTIDPTPKGPISAFNALFSVNPLEETENLAIERIFVEGYEPGLSSQEHISEDLQEIKRLTQELKAIKKQEMLLIGERIYQAREIFKKYKERSFREWVELTFGSFKTGYNYLSFYDLHTALPIELRDELKKMPAKAVYILASKKVSIEDKAQFVKDNAFKTASNLISLIRNTLGRGEGEKSIQDDSLAKILRTLQREVSKLCQYPKTLNIEDKQTVSFLIERLYELID